MSGGGDREGGGQVHGNPQEPCLLHPPLPKTVSIIRLFPGTAEKCLKSSRGRGQKGWQPNKESESQAGDGSAPSERAGSGLTTHLTMGH